MKRERLPSSAYILRLKHFTDVAEGIRTPDDELAYLTSELGLPRITLDPLFRRFVSHWNDGPTLDAAYFALEAMHIVDPGFRTPADVRRDLEKQLAACYLDADDGFWPTPFGTSASLYGTLCAVGIMKSLGGCGCGERPGDNVEECDDYYSRFFGHGFPERIERLVMRRASRDAGACWDSAAWRTPCVISTSVAASLLWNVGYDASSLLDILPAEQITSFLTRSVFRHELPPVAWEGFRPHPDHERPGLSVTHHALKLVNRLDLELPADIDKVRAFIHLCWTGEGFSATIGESPSMISSYYALSCLREETLCGPDEDFVSRIAGKLVRFVQSCCDQGVFSLSPKLLPNAAATRYAIQILSQGFPEMSNVSRPQQVEFILHQFWKRGTGFMAYPVRVVEQTSAVFGYYGVLGELSNRLTLALSPLLFLWRIFANAWAHRRSP